MDSSISVDLFRSPRDTLDEFKEEWKRTDRWLEGWYARLNYEGIPDPEDYELGESDPYVLGYWAADDTL